MVGASASIFVAPDEAPDVVAVIPTLGGHAERLRATVDSLREQRHPLRLTVLVVLNTPDQVHLPDLGDDVVVLRPGFNLGWGGALAFGRSRAGAARRMWLVQDDMTFDPGCLAALWAALDADDALALASPLIVGRDGLVAAGSCGGVLHAERARGMDHWYPPVPLAVDEVDGLELLDYVPSRGMLVELAVWDGVGGMFPGFYPLVWADVDYCASVRASGFRFRLVLAARAEHRQQGSTPAPYARLLYERHAALFARRWADGARDDPVYDEVPPEVALAVAKAAASLASDLARRYVEGIAELEDPLLPPGAEARPEAGPATGRPQRASARARLAALWRRLGGR